MSTQQDASPDLPPGPWSCKFTYMATGAFSTFGQRPVFDVYDRDGQWIARAAAETQEQAQAIAVLIVAAPDLLAALDQLLDDMGDTGLSVCGDAKNLARAAVIKATATAGGT